MSKSVTGPNRAIAAAGVLVAVWIVVWWLTPVRPEPGLTFANEPAARVLTRTDAVPVEPQAAATRADWTEPPATPAREARASVAPPTSAAPTANDGSPRTYAYTVRSGDTMKSIAKNVLGDGQKWSIIARANPRVDPIKLRVGMVLQIPHDPTNLQGAPPPNASTASSQPGSPDGPTREYVVQSGDTLSEIAQRQLGASARWPDLLKANESLLRSPRDLRPGMRLRIPAR